MMSADIYDDDWKNSKSYYIIYDPLTRKTINNVMNDNNRDDLNDKFQRISRQIIVLVQFVMF